MTACPGPDDQSDDFGAFTRLQQQASLSGHPSNDARGLLGHRDESGVLAQEYTESPSYLIDGRRIPKLRREATDGLGVVDGRGTNVEGGVQGGSLVR